MTPRNSTVLLVDRDGARARRSATLLGSERTVVIVANSIADALVLIAIRAPELAIVTLGENSEPRTCASALRGVVPDLHIVFTGEIAPHHTNAIEALDAGKHYLPMLSQTRLRMLLARRPVRRLRPTITSPSSPSG